MTALNTPITASDTQAFRRGLTAGIVASVLLAAAIALAWAIGPRVFDLATPAGPIVDVRAPSTEISVDNPYVRGPKIAY